jgi:hypothetical protein
VIVVEDMKMYNVNEVYLKLKNDIDSFTKPGMQKRKTFSKYCESRGLNKNTTAVFIETMSRLDKSIIPQVAVSRSGQAKNFVGTLANMLHVEPSTATNQFHIPLSFAMWIARLNKTDQVVLVDRWRSQGLDIDFAKLRALVSTAKTDGFELAYQQVFTTYARRLEIQQVALILASMRSEKLVKELLDCGYEPSNVSATVNSLVYAGILKSDKTHKTYELSGKFYDMLERAFKPLPTNAPAIWITTTLDSIGVLRVNANKTRVRAIVKAMKEKVQHYEEEVERSAPIPVVKK